jgi:hypothetical protein
MLAIIMREPRVVGVVGLDAAGRARASRQGIGQFVVGTGGADLLGFAAAKPNSQRRLAGVHVFAWNRPAIRCYEKAGFREIGRRRGGRSAWAAGSTSSSWTRSPRSSPGRCSPALFPEHDNGDGRAVGWIMAGGPACSWRSDHAV